MCTHACWEDKEFKEISTGFQFENCLSILLYLSGEGGAWAG